MDQHENVYGIGPPRGQTLCCGCHGPRPKAAGNSFLQGGKPFIETVIVEEKPVLKKLADWLVRGARRQAQGSHLASRRRHS